MYVVSTHFLSIDFGKIKILHRTIAAGSSIRCTFDGLFQIPIFCFCFVYHSQYAVCTHHTSHIECIKDKISIHRIFAWSSYLLSFLHRVFSVFVLRSWIMWCWCSLYVYIVLSGMRHINEAIKQIKCSNRYKFIQLPFHLHANNWISEFYFIKFIVLMWIVDVDVWIVSAIINGLQYKQNSLFSINYVVMADSTEFVFAVVVAIVVARLKLFYTIIDRYVVYLYILYVNVNCEIWIIDAHIRWHKSIEIDQSTLSQFKWRFFFAANFLYEFMFMFYQTIP